MKPVFLIPGISNSGPGHWQSEWEKLYPNVMRITQRDWDSPVCDDWVSVMDSRIRAAILPPILVAHSLGCLAVAHWAVASNAPIDSALLVAPPDPYGDAFPPGATGFAPLPQAITGRRLKIISSSDDPYSSEAYAAECARRWGAEHISLGNFGHINTDSGLGTWPIGWAFVKEWL